jgi:hypothetical protein
MLVEKSGAGLFRASLCIPERNQSHRVVRELNDGNIDLNQAE